MLSFYTAALVHDSREWFDLYRDSEAVQVSCFTECQLTSALPRTLHTSVVVLVMAILVTRADVSFRVPLLH